MKIGITERGDASLNYTWVDKLNSIDGAVLITKNVTDKFIETVLPFKDKVILHATVTGYGSTKLEPNVMSVMQSMKQLSKLVKAGFPVERIVLRVDPIIPTEKGIRIARDVIETGYRQGIHRVRISVIDMYPHVRQRFEEAGIPLPYGENFSASDEQFKAVDNMLMFLIINHFNPTLNIESCAEPKLQVPTPVGCIDLKDWVDLPLEAIPTIFGAQFGVKSRQRTNCMCSSCKTELLNNRTRCPNGCLYCYWKDKSST